MSQGKITEKELEPSLVEKINSIKNDGTLQLKLNSELVNGKSAKTEPKTNEKSDLIGMINETFQYANDGKLVVANAIKGKGVSASSSDTFAQLATKIESLPSTTIDGDRYNSNLDLLTYRDYDAQWKQVSTLPIEFFQGSAIVYKNEIHILGGYRLSSAHYKWTGVSWVSVSTLPVTFNNGCVVVYNNELHIIGGPSGMIHYKWDGTSWTKLNVLPFRLTEGCAVIYNNEIHVLGGTNDNTAHYKLVGDSWVNVSTLPYPFYSGSAVVHRNKIYILGTRRAAESYNIYYWDGVSWTNASDILPYGGYYGCAITYDNKIHVLGGNSGKTNHYHYDGLPWTSYPSLPYNLYRGCVVEYNNQLHILGSMEAGTSHYSIMVKPLYIKK